MSSRRECKDDSSSLHPDRGRIRKQQLDKNTRQIRALKERHLNRKKSAKEQSKLKINLLVNKTRRLTRQLKKAEEKACDYSSDDILALSMLQCMTSNSKNKTLKLAASTPGFSPVRIRKAYSRKLRKRPILL